MMISEFHPVEGRGSPNVLFADDPFPIGKRGRRIGKLAE